MPSVNLSAVFKFESNELSFLHDKDQDRCSNSDSIEAKCSYKLCQSKRLLGALEVC